MSLSSEARIAIDTRAKAVEGTEALLASGTGRVEGIIEMLIAELESSDALLVPLLGGDARATGAADVAVNVAILALRIGMNLQCSQLELAELGRAALLHASARGARHGRPDARRNGTSEIRAQVIALAASYDALSRQQPSGPREWPPAAVKELLRRERAHVPNAVLKAAVEMLVSFPISGLVRLNSGEVGCVVKKNRGLPLRPVVAIARHRGRPLSAEKIIDLADNPFLYVREFLGYDASDADRDGEAS